MSTNPADTGGSLVHQAVQAVRSHIRLHDMKVGDTLPGEGQFAAQLGVSRAVMREAFGALAALKLIDVGNGRRARVGATLDHAVTTAQISVAEVWDVRRTVEVRIAALAAEKRTGLQAQMILNLAEAMAGAQEDQQRMIQHDIAFHETIAQAAGNALFSQIVQSFAPLMKVAVPQAWRTRTSQEQKDNTIRLHRTLARAIADANPAAAAAAMEAHFDTSIGDILRGAPA
jgi:GntR family transcriptional regulator, transcriptional repressor for pyruvate dehydrogenase complex